MVILLGSNIFIRNPNVELPKVLSSQTECNSFLAAQKQACKHNFSLEGTPRSASISISEGPTAKNTSPNLRYPSRCSRHITVTRPLGITVYHH